MPTSTGAAVNVKGFTLIELMITLTIAAILLAIGVPSFRSLIQNQRMTTTVNDLFFFAINLTRSQALQMGGRVDLAPIDNADWSKGWRIFVNKPNDTDLTYNSDDQLVFSHGPIPNGITITTAFTDGVTQYITYNGTGRTRTNTSSQTPQLGTITLTQDTQIRRIKLNFLGRPRVCDPAQEPTTCTSTADTK
ncbi:GspH/FimT family pseudopilin [Undibacterium arcticum]